MKYRTYILYSAELQKYYVGYTSQPMEERLKRHLSDHKGYTSNAKDWRVVYEQNFTTKSEAMKKEKQIKKRGAKRFLIDEGLSG